MDIDRAEDGASEALAALEHILPTTERERSQIARDTGRTLVRATKERIHLTAATLEDGPEDDLERRELDLLIGPNVVVTIREGPAAAVERFATGIEGETAFGDLSAADLASSIIDEVIAGYFLLVEQLEREIDALDQRALRRHPDEQLPERLVDLRRRISLLRRSLAPLRSALVAMARPVMQADDQVGRPWPQLVDRVDTAMDAVEGLREALIGTYDIHMGRLAQHANDVMRTLTIVSAVLLPAVVLAGVMGMNFQLAFFDTNENFFVVLAAMAILAGAIVVIARWRRWL